MGNDLERLQGEWNVTSLIVDEQETPSAMLAGARIRVRGNRFTSSGMEAVYEGFLELDAAATPRRLDMHFDAGPEKGNVNRCIYELKPDAWKLCIATRGGAYPESFAAPAGTGLALEILRRQTGVPVSAEAPGEAEPLPVARTASEAAGEMEGEWAMVAGVMDGAPVESSMTRWVKRVTEGTRTTVYAGPQVMLKVDFTHDPSQSPKTIDYFHLAGSLKGKTQLGIYVLEEGRLTVCMGGAGESRPNKFESTRGDGRTLTVWQS